MRDDSKSETLVSKIIIKVVLSRVRSRRSLRERQGNNEQASNATVHR